MPVLTAPPVVIAKPVRNFLPTIIGIAQSQIGVSEQPPGSNRGSEIEEYLGSVGLPEGQCLSN